MGINRESHQSKRQLEVITSYWKIFFTMSKNSAVNEPSSAETLPQKQLDLSAESDAAEEYEEDDYEETEDDSSENSLANQNMKKPPSPPMRIRVKKYHLPAEQLTWFENQSDKEKRRPRLEHGNQASWKQFRAEHKIYREEKNGNQPMVNLISIKAKISLSIHLSMDTSSFLKLTDEQVTTILDKHLKLNQISNYKEILSRCHMVKSTNDNISIDKIQLDTEGFKDRVSQNPHFQREQKRYETDVETTSVSKRDETKYALQNEDKVHINGKYCSHCISTRPNLARGHTDATCYYLHPEKRKEKEERDKAKKDKDLPKVAHFAEVQALKDELKGIEQQMQFMSCLLSNQKDEDA